MGHGTLLNCIHSASRLYDGAISVEHVHQHKGAFRAELSLTDRVHPTGGTGADPVHEDRAQAPFFRARVPLLAYPGILSLRSKSAKILSTEVRSLFLVTHFALVDHTDS